MKNISKHITYKEATKSDTAIRHGLDNTPNESELEKMSLVAEKVFEPARVYFGVPIYVSSFFRSEDVNKKAGGSKTSSHRLGEAIDADCDVYGGITNLQLFEYIRDNLEFDQLIWEYDNPDGTPAWVHMSFRKSGNRKQVMKAYKEDGETKYKYL